MLTKLLIQFLLLKLVASSATDFIFNGFSGANLTLNGIAEITSSGLLQLTNNTKTAFGRGFYHDSFHFKHPSGKPLSFSTTFVLAIVLEHDDVSTYGMAFALSPTKELLGIMPGAYFGLFTTSNIGKATNHIIAVEFDTNRNLGFGDKDNNHVGIDINDVRSVNASPVAYIDNKNELQSLKLTSGDPMQVWIDYKEDMKLEVRIAPIGSSRPRLPLVSSDVNLSSIVLEEMYMGFTATTEDSTGFHYILGWSFSLGGNAKNLDIAKLPSVPYPETTKKGSPVLAVAFSLIAVLVLLMSIAGVMFVVIRRKQFAEILEDWELEYGPHRFRYKDLLRATNGFKDENFLGVGGFGRVYKGVLHTSKLEIAVKRISQESQQGMQEFVAEIVSMGRLRHRNLVQLLGYCRRRGELLLVYEFMPNGSLDKFLFDGGRTTLSWVQRFHIIKGVASGLLYLHDGWEHVVIHRDIKAANVLLDDFMNGKLGDFGLMKLYERGSDLETTHIVGTLGYLAPELSETGKATTKTDVYAYGAFLLEVACGRRPIEIHAMLPNLVDWVFDFWKRGELLRASDPKLGTDYLAEEMELVLKLGLFCSHPDPVARPCMRQVMQFLEGDSPLPVMSMDFSTASARRYDTTASIQRFDTALDNFDMPYPSISSNSSEWRSSSPFLSMD